MTSQPLLDPLEKVVKKYKASVNQLKPGASNEAIEALSTHLERSLPADLKAILYRCNGALLFRGSLRIRSSAEITVASADSPNLFLFADRDDIQYAWTNINDEDVVIGSFNGEVFVPLHASFSAWMAAEVAILEGHIAHPIDEANERLKKDPTDAVQCIHHGKLAIENSDYDRAISLLTTATASTPGDATGWLYLGDALQNSDPDKAAKAWVKALQLTRLPLPYPGLVPIDQRRIEAVAHAFQDPKRYESLLGSVLTNQASDISTEVELQFAAGVAKSRAKSQLSRGDRQSAKAGLSELVAKVRVSTLNAEPWEALLMLADIEADLASFDEAEALLKRFDDTAPTIWAGRAQLSLGRIATERHEPWAEQIISDAQECHLGPRDQIAGYLLLAERHIRVNKSDQAEEVLNRLESVSNTLNAADRAGILMLRGDIARFSGSLKEAREMYLQVSEIATKRQLVELGLRATIRLGDTDVLQDQPREAAIKYRTAVEGYQLRQLPLRTAWALIRLANVSADSEPLLLKAKEIFLEADHAAGVASLDVAMGVPGTSIEWHMERATQHVRARNDAQRSRPPWVRSDAERPERRLGAHRIAISATPKNIVPTIASVMEESAGQMMGGRARLSDPPVTRYVAAADLLASHPSFEAATVLVSHLLGKRVDGDAWEALKGAITRAPSTPLVDSLLQVLEGPTGRQPSEVALAAEVMGLRREAAATRSLIKLAAPGTHIVIRKAAIIALGRLGDPAATAVLEKALDDDTLGGNAALSLLCLGERTGVDLQAKLLSEGRCGDLVSPGEIVGRYGGPVHLLLLRNAASIDDDASLDALQGLGLMGDPCVIPTLVSALQSSNQRRVEVAGAAIQVLTGHDIDTEKHGWRKLWHDWWDMNQSKFKAGSRYRGGKLFGAKVLIKRMESSDSWVRRTAYDELVVMSGVREPFDANGPWRVQQMHIKKWRQWYTQNSDQFPPGRWFLNGESSL